MPWPMLVLVPAVLSVVLAVDGRGLPLRPLLLGLAAAHGAAFVAFAESGAMECHPGCSAYQDALGYAVFLLLPAALVAALAAAFWRLRRR